MVAWEGSKVAKAQGRKGAGGQRRRDARGQGGKGAAKSQNRNSQGPAPQYQTFILFGAVILLLILLGRPLKPLFTLQSNPDAPAPADLHPAADFADQIRLVGVESWPAVIELSETDDSDLTVTLYWRALQTLDTNYSIFLHLDAPNGQTLATVDEVNPESIPTRNWPPGLYLRNPLHLRLPPNLPPIRYNLTTGVYNRETGERLPLANGTGSAYVLGPVWLDAPAAESAAQPLATFGDGITLHRADLSGDTLLLGWRTAAPIATDASIFVHVLDSNGNLLAQADGVPFNGLYPLSNWLPGQFIEDTRQLTLPAETTTLAIGIYDPATAQRLPATDTGGKQLPNDSFIFTVTQ